MQEGLTCGGAGVVVRPITVRDDVLAERYSGLELGVEDVDLVQEQDEVCLAQ